jgi:hypothetical protein
MQKMSERKITIKKDGGGDKYAEVSGVRYYIRTGRGNRGSNGYQGFHINRINQNGNPVYVRDFDNMEEVKGYLANL